MSNTQTISGSDLENSKKLLKELLNQHLSEHPLREGERVTFLGTSLGGSIAEVLFEGDVVVAVDGTYVDGMHSKVVREITDFQEFQPDHLALRVRRIETTQQMMGSYHCFACANACCPVCKSESIYDDGATWTQDGCYISSSYCTEGEATRTRCMHCDFVFLHASAHIHEYCCCAVESDCECDIAEEMVSVAREALDDAKARKHTHLCNRSITAQ